MSFVDADWPLPGDPGRVPTMMDRWRDRARTLGDPDLADFALTLAEDAQGGNMLRAIFGGSPYLAETALRDMAIVREIVADGSAATVGRLIGAVGDIGLQENDTNRLMAGLRRSKRGLALAVALADIGGHWDLARVTAALSDFAEAALAAAASHLLARAAARGTLPPAAAADPGQSGLIVLGMGKLGARELNYSSDIDLVILFDEDRVGSGRPSELSPTFSRFARDLVRIMEDRTAEGYVFRTDLRLRPDPGITPPAVSVAAAETYYTSLAQTWERAAMIKARPVAGDRAAGEAFLGFLTPFIWRRSLDFAAIQDIDAIKRQIHRHKGHGAIAVEGHDLKLGRGGIREIEFFVQTQQLVFGGQDSTLRCRGTLEGLAALSAAGRCDAATEGVLAEAYRFLRRAEHRIQMVEDRQTHSLPADAEGFARFSRFLGFPGPDDARDTLRAVLAAVENRYDAFFDDRAADGPRLVFAGTDDDPETLQTLEGFGFVRPGDAIATIRGWLHGRYRALRSERARQLLVGFLPRLLAAFGRTADPDGTLARFDAMVARLSAGVQIFSLFHANPGLFGLVGEMLGLGGRLTDDLAADPARIESVLAPGFFAALPDAPGVTASLDRRLQAARDYEDALDLLRHWARDQRFRAGIHVLRAISDSRRIGEFLSDVAGAALAALLPRVEAEFARRHGRTGDGLAIVAMGKLGGREMTVRSDLDLIMIYDGDGQAASDGEKPLPAMVYHARLVQRLVSAITAPTGAGALFEVDMRLRPSGNAGPLSTSFAAFLRYHESEAWTWEHMALTRARVVAGPPALTARIAAAIGTILAGRRDADALRRDVARMRDRIDRQHGTDDPWTLKYVRGGLVDIEFVVQYLQLRHAAEKPEVLHPTTAIALERLAAAGLITPADRQALADALDVMQRLQAFLRLVATDRFDPTQAAPDLVHALCRVASLPNASLAGIEADLRRRAAGVRAVYDRLIGPAPDQ
jgi:glutamate-ammonia-ligase adenylyltransferase